MFSVKKNHGIVGIQLNMPSNSKSTIILIERSSQQNVHSFNNVFYVGKIFRNINYSHIDVSFYNDIKKKKKNVRKKTKVFIYYEMAFHIMGYFCKFG